MKPDIAAIKKRANEASQVTDEIRFPLIAGNLIDRDIPALLAYIEQLEALARDAEILLHAECEECKEYIAGICVSHDCNVLAVANKLDELLPPLPEVPNE